MYVLIDPKGRDWRDKRSWHAFQPLSEEGSFEVKKINIEVVRDPRCSYFYVSEGVGRVGWWPGVSSDEWIEYIPEGFVEPQPSPCGCLFPRTCSKCW
jgi:hypothetical protein